MVFDARSVAQALGGDVVNRDSVSAPGPGHSRKDRSLSIRLDANAPGGFIVNSFAGDDPLACRDYVRQRLGLPDWQPGDGQDTALARRYDLSTDSIYRHKKAHLPPQLRAKLIAGPDCDLDLDRLRESESQSLLANLVALRHRLFASLDVAEECGDSNMVCRVTAQLHANLELTGKLLGDLGVGSVTNNVLVLPEYVEMRVALVDALAAFPEARRAVAAVLHGLEHKAAEEITAQAERPLFEATPVEEVSL
jgi:hypothetical protein